MSAGIADFVIEQGADWAIQIFWVNEQTGDPIRAQGPMDMDIVNARTGQRLIRLDDLGNGGIDTGGAPYGIIQLSIDDATTEMFAPGNYVYDLFVYAYGPPAQRLKLLAGNVTVAAQITDLGSTTMQGMSINPSVLPPDIELAVAASGAITIDMNNPTNQYANLENGVPVRAGLRGAPTVPNATACVYHNIAGTKTGPVQNPYAQNVTGATVNSWLNEGAVVTVYYKPQNQGLVVTKIEAIPGATASPQLALATAAPETTSDNGGVDA